MISKYTHMELNKEVTSIAGYYSPQKEVRLRHNNREVLYIVGHAVLESSCCAASSWEYAIVPGYIHKWQNRTNEVGLPVSEVEPVSDREAQKKIRRVITETEVVSQVEFW